MGRDIIAWEGQALDVNSIVSIELPKLYTSCDGAMGQAHVTYRVHTTNGTIDKKTYFDFCNLPYRMRDELGNRLDTIQWKYVDGSYHSIMGSHSTDANIKAIADAMTALEPLMEAWGNIKKPRCLTSSCAY